MQSYFVKNLLLNFQGLATVLFIYVKTQTPIFPVSCYLNVLIILDRSDSVKGGFNRSRDFVVNVSEELDVGPKTHRVSNSYYFYGEI